MSSDQILFYLVIIGIGAFIGFAVLAGILRFLFSLLKGLFGFGRVYPRYSDGYGYGTTELPEENSDNSPIVSVGKLMILLLIGFAAVNLVKPGINDQAAVTPVNQEKRLKSPLQKDPVNAQVTLGSLEPVTGPEKDTKLDDLAEFESKEKGYVDQEQLPLFCIQVSSFSTKSRAYRKAEILRSKGHQSATVAIRNGYYCTVISGFKLEENAKKYALYYGYKPITWLLENND